MHIDMELMRVCVVMVTEDGFQGIQGKLYVTSHLAQRLFDANSCNHR